MANPAMNLDSADSAYNWDVVLVFPRIKGIFSQQYTGTVGRAANSDDAVNEKFNLDRFLRLMLGLRTQKIAPNEPERTIMDRAHMVLKTDRCFLNSLGQSLIKATSEEVLGDTDLVEGGLSKVSGKMGKMAAAGVAQGRAARSLSFRQGKDCKGKDHKLGKATRKAAAKSNDTMADEEELRLQQMKAALTHEYDDPLYDGSNRGVNRHKATTDICFCELVCRCVVKRLQDTCGLTTRMKVSMDGDEIIVVVKADSMDLRVEADRTDYQLQVHNRPFTQPRDFEALQRYTFNAVHKASFPKAYAASVRLLRERCGPSDPNIEPELDPALFYHNWHPNLRLGLYAIGHEEEGRGRDGIYIAPYADYKIDEKFQPFYRHYDGMDESERLGISLFRPIDRIRLVNSIIARNVNLPALQCAGFLTGHFALHEPEKVALFREAWALNWGLSRQPLLDIRDYFGEKIAYYFAWLEFYTKMLIFPAAGGIAVFALNSALALTHDQQGALLIVFGGAVAVWSTCFIELWKRKQCVLNLWWGMSNLHAEVEPRPQFHGKLRYSPVNDRVESWHISMGTLAFRCSVTWVVCGISVLLTLSSTIFCLRLKYTLVVEKQVPFGTAIAGGINAGQIAMFNEIYRMLARKMTSWENHRSQMEYENNLIVKTFLFRFFNNYFAFFYIAFIKAHAESTGCINNDCMAELGKYVATIFIIQLVVGNAIELVGPWMKYKVRMHKEKLILGGGTQFSSKIDSRYEKPEMEAKYEPYEEKEAFDDYAEMVIQFGVVTLFVVAFPLAPVLALANNVLELHVDAFKLVDHRRRPSPHKANSIGTWAYFVNLISKISVMTNVATIIFTSDVFGKLNSPESRLTMVERWLVFMVTQHVLLTAKQLVADYLPDKPAVVETLEKRHAWLVGKVFQGLVLDDNGGFEEIPEKVDLTIHDNSACLTEEGMRRKRAMVAEAQSAKIAEGKAEKRATLKNSGLGPQQGVTEAPGQGKKKKKRGNGKPPPEGAAVAHQDQATDFSGLNGRSSVIYGKPAEGFNEQGSGHKYQSSLNLDVGGTGGKGSKTIV